MQIYPNFNNIIRPNMILKIQIYGISNGKVLNKIMFIDNVS